MAVSVADAPAQRVDAEELIMIVGVALTFTVIEEVAEQPLEFEPVTL